MLASDPGPGLFPGRWLCLHVLTVLSFAFLPSGLGRAGLHVSCRHAALGLLSVLLPILEVGNWMFASSYTFLRVTKAQLSRLPSIVPLAFGLHVRMQLFRIRVDGWN